MWKRCMTGKKKKLVLDKMKRKTNWEEKKDALCQKTGKVWSYFHFHHQGGSRPQICNRWSNKELSGLAGEN